ncbi:MAG TPA: succinate dehydrogenase assembly factor 2 [Mariprofundaceae bacterium]|nr:succinate dehydrogenase assembly factor 2 [Mariprofundaceae bacterium]
MTETALTDTELAIRRLRYRLNRQGMLELDAWLGPLLEADFSQPDVRAATEALLNCEPPELQRLLHGETPLPEILKPWLSR